MGNSILPPVLLERHTRTPAGVSRNMRNIRLCSVSGCGKKHHGLGYCKKHHKRFKQRTYTCWRDMIRRCSDDRHKDFERYGGRGILVCERWLSFDNFLSDMGEIPQRMSLERINNDGSYSPENCRWASYPDQARNKSVTRKVTHNGVTMCLTDWSKKTGITLGAIRYRYKAGWDVEKMLTQPIESRKNWRLGVRHDQP